MQIKPRTKYQYAKSYYINCYITELDIAILFVKSTYTHNIYKRGNPKQWHVCSMCRWKFDKVWRNFCHWTGYQKFIGVFASNVILLVLSSSQRNCVHPSFKEYINLSISPFVIIWKYLTSLLFTQVCYIHNLQS